MASWGDFLADSDVFSFLVDEIQKVVKYYKGTMTHFSISSGWAPSSTANVAPASKPSMTSWGNFLADSDVFPILDKIQR